MSSRSCRFSRSSSANRARSLIDNGDSETGFASRYHATQLPSVPSWIRNSRATCAIARPDSITSRTASSLNSGVYRERSLDSLAIVVSSIFIEMMETNCPTDGTHPRLGGRLEFDALGLRASDHGLLLGDR